MIIITSQYLFMSRRAFSTRCSTSSSSSSSSMFKRMNNNFTTTTMTTTTPYTQFFASSLSATLFSQMRFAARATYAEITSALVVLGVTMLLGKKFTTPTSVRDGMKGHVSSVYVLGIFSAIATTCCAPVLAGVLALSVASGTIVWGALYTLAYVVGMTLPLFIIAAFLDKANLTERFTNAKKTVAMRIGGLSWKITVSELISGLIFLLMCAYITYLAFRNQLFTHSSYQLEMNLWNARFLGAINGWTTLIPEYVWALLFVGIVVSISYVFIRQYRKTKI